MPFLKAEIESASLESHGLRRAGRGVSTTVVIQLSMTVQMIKSEVSKIP